MILSSLKNFIGDHLSKLQRMPAKFGNLGRNLITEKLKREPNYCSYDNLQMSNAGSLWQSFRHSSVILIASVDF